jgi:hypothetical protein
MMYLHNFASEVAWFCPGDGVERLCIADFLAGKCRDALPAW